MGISKMKYINVYGPDEKLQQTIGAIARAGCFAPEENQAIHTNTHFGQNQYEPLLVKAKGLLKDMGQSSVAADFYGNESAYEYGQVADYLEKYAEIISARSVRKAEIEGELELYVKTRDLLGRMTDIDIDLEDLFNIKYLHMRIGRLPKNSYAWLRYYSEKSFNFTNYFNFMVYDFDGEYYWGMYFAPEDSKQDIDDIFTSLYFERVWIPEFVHGRPEEAIAAIANKEKELKGELDTIITPAGLISEGELNEIQQMTAWLHYMSQLYVMKRYAIEFDNTFYISGFVPEESYKDFENLIGTISHVEIKEAAKNQKIPVQPPTKLRNGWFSRPYQMFTEMYGLPSTRDIDPTGIVAVIYSVLYGIMFADFGQGIVLFLISYFYMYKKRGMPIGRVISRCSVFSMIFGFLFGGFFGNEELICELLQKAGIAFKPIAVMDPANTNSLLIGSLAIGVVVVILAIGLGIISKFRRGVKGEAITSPNGIAGFVFYIALILFALDMLVLKNGFSKNPLYIIFLFVVPVIVMYLQEPLAHLINTGKFEFKNPSDILIGGFFEVFVALLEYLSHTVSFLRVGGFVFAHAGMMSVVMTLANMASGAASIAVLIIGNIFVIALEGLIVGIQALRLNYYELFSRFYEADGMEFKPLTIQSDTVEL